MEQQEYVGTTNIAYEANTQEQLDKTENPTTTEDSKLGSYGVLNYGFESDMPKPNGGHILTLGDVMRGRVLELDTITRRASAFGVNSLSGRELQDLDAAIHTIAAHLENATAKDELPSYEEVAPKRKNRKQPAQHAIPGNRRLVRSSLYAPSCGRKSHTIEGQWSDIHLGDDEFPETNCEESCEGTKNQREKPKRKIKPDPATDTITEDRVEHSGIFDSVDELLAYTRGFGLYQRVMFFVLSLALMGFMINKMSVIFLMDIPDHRCSIPNLEKFNISEEVLLNVSIPRMADGTYSMCTMYDRDYSNWTLEDVIDAVTAPKPDNVGVVGCPDGWVYDRSSYISTFATEFNLVCGRTWFRAIASSMYFLSELLGLLAFGSISDLLGRRKTLIGASTLTVLGTFASAFAPTYITFVLLRAVVAMSSIALATTANISVLEMVSSEYRVPVYLSFQMFYTIGCVKLAGLAYFIRNHIYLVIAIGIFQSLYLGYYFIAPESIRWMYMKGKYEEGETLARYIGKMNGVPLPENFKVRTESSDGSTSVSLLSLLKYPRLRLRTILMSFIWMVNALMFFGLNLGSSSMGSDPYFNLLLLATIEIPAVLLSMPTSSMLGRIPVMCSSHVVAGLILLTSSAVPDGMPTAAVILSTAGKFAVTMSFTLINMYVGEVSPTPVRGVIISICAFIGGLGTIVAPYMVQLVEVSKYIPPVTFGSLALLAGLATLLLPETRGAKMPETLEQGEHFGKLEKTSDSGLAKKVSRAWPSVEIYTLELGNSGTSSEI